MNSLRLPPLSLYVHIPWCVRKCPYCDFNSHTNNGDELPEKDYVDALLEDLANAASEEILQGRKLVSIFFGGGTPSLFSAAAIGRILHGAEQIIGFAANIEITLEANPGTAEQQKFKGFRQAGVNRLSIGIQSFNDGHLKRLGRIHTAAQALSAISLARQAGFDNINLDLMHGLPEQTPEQAIADLQQAIALHPEHLSWYQLTIEPSTAFHSQPPLLPVENTLESIQTRGHELLESAGFSAYEISAYARPQRQSQHNCNYWQFGDYLGIGAGAHGKITDISGQKILRTRKTRQPTDYLSRLTKSGDYLAEQFSLSEAELPLEFLMNALRLKQGVPAALFAERTGLPLKTIATHWQALEAKHLVAPLSAGRLNCTALGHRFLDSILAEF
ncbi:MAG: radical SAM family heme chaperone HemW [Gammaproteobacteria bacterium]|nr:radical SAM family heme chaperone HemW [Gammaproteobacteria bacterium]MBQ0839128.1 radical SAM family heme chaperone HemW [Gammaproteobacteria bacterium]